MNEITHKSPRRFDKEFKLAALECWRASGKTRKEVADDLGISEWNLRDWKEDVERDRERKLYARKQQRVEIGQSNPPNVHRSYDQF